MLRKNEELKCLFQMLAASLQEAAQKMLEAHSKHDYINKAIQLVDQLNIDDGPLLRRALSVTGDEGWSESPTPPTPPPVCKDTPATECLVPIKRTLSRLSGPLRLQP
uniref:Uncharacterized protein n=1 Tax=Arundo donax TaxID=35708 RepID=A0A0A8YUU4_ARUDO